MTSAAWAHRERLVTCEECGNKYPTAATNARYCPDCRYAVKLRKQRERDRKRPKTWVHERRCSKCGKTKPTAGNFGRQPSGRIRSKCIKCEGRAAHEDPVPEKRFPTSWLLPRPLTKREALMYRVGGPSPCFHCYHASKCQERNAALDDRPLPCFEGDE